MLGTGALADDACHAARERLAELPDEELEPVLAPYVANPSLAMRSLQ